MTDWEALAKRKTKPRLGAAEYATYAAIDRRANKLLARSGFFRKNPAKTEDYQPFPAELIGRNGLRPIAGKP